MSTFNRNLAESLDPVLMAQRLGTEPDPWQATAMRSTSPRIALNAHRQSGKSETATIKALHTAIYRPGSTVVVVSPSQRQSWLLFDRIVAAYEKAGRPVEVLRENRSELVLANGSRIYALPGDPESIRGIPAVHLLIIDEAAFVTDDLFVAVSPMLAVTRGQLLAISTPKGRRGWFFESCTDPSRGWEVTVVRADENPRMDPEFLAAERAQMTDLQFKQEYLCEWVEGAGSLFAAEDIYAALGTISEPFDPEAAAPGRAGRLSHLRSIS